MRTLDALCALTNRYPAHFADQLDMIYTELAQLVNDLDIKKAALSLKACANLIRNVGIGGSKCVVHEAARFAGSVNVLAGSEAIRSLGVFFETAVDKDAIDAETL